MSIARQRPAIATMVIFGLLALLGAYFTFAAVQGNHGVLSRIEIDAQTQDLRAERARLAERLAALENRTRRLSDDFLDLDLLDERARAVLGYARADDLVIR